MTPLDTSHIPEIQKLAFITWNETYTDILSKEQLDFMLDEIYNFESLKKQINEGQDFYGYLIDEKMVGFASISRYNDTDHKLNKIYLLKEYQGTGIGSKMLIFIENLCKFKGCKNLILNVNKHNPTKSFYEKLGFQVKEEVDIPIGKYWMNDYVMIKTI